MYERPSSYALPRADGGTQEHPGKQSKHDSAEANQQAVPSPEILPVNADAQVAASHVDMHAPSSVDVEHRSQRAVKELAA